MYTFDEEDCPSPFPGELCASKTAARQKLTTAQTQPVSTDATLSDQGSNRERLFLIILHNIFYSFNLVLLFLFLFMGLDQN